MFNRTTSGNQLSVISSQPSARELREYLTADLRKQDNSRKDAKHAKFRKHLITADFRRLSQMKNGKAQSAKRIASAFKPSALSRQPSAPDSLLLAAYCLLLTLYALRHALCCAPVYDNLRLIFPCLSLTRNFCRAATHKWKSRSK